MATKYDLFCYRHFCNTNLSERLVIRGTCQYNSDVIYINNNFSHTIFLVEYIQLNKKFTTKEFNKTWRGGHYAVYDAHSCPLASSIQ